MAKIVKAEKVKLTAGRIQAFECPKDKDQAYLWCNEVKGLGIRATVHGAKSYFFQAKVKAKSMRVTIGGVKAWTIPAAQAEARRLQTIIDQGNDPRQVKADIEVAAEAQAAALAKKQISETVTLGVAWSEYLDARKPFWSERHYDDQLKATHLGGKPRKRGKKLTEPGTLASLVKVRIVNLTPERITEWAKEEGKKRPGCARLALRQLKAFLSWCGEHKEYKSIVVANAAKNKSARELLGKPKALNDVLQREQLKAWFSAVKQITNPVISVYCQALLLTGARPNELASIRWTDIDFQWDKLTIHDKVEGERTIPLTPYFKSLLLDLRRRNESPPVIDLDKYIHPGRAKKLAEKIAEWKPSPWVFSSPMAAGGFLIDPHDAFKKACNEAGIELTIYGLRRSFATLSEWIEAPAGIAGQIQGHAPSGVREKHYIRRPIDLLRMWHVKIEAWILNEAGIVFSPAQNGLHLVPSLNADALNSAV